MNSLRVVAGLGELSLVCVINVLADVGEGDGNLVVSSTSADSLTSSKMSSDVQTHEMKYSQ